MTYLLLDNYLKSMYLKKSHNKNCGTVKEVITGTTK